MRKEVNENKALKKCSISSDIFRQLYLLSIIARFSRGSYGSKRLHKVTYIAERRQKKLRPFEFKKYHYGQYSETLEETKDQLITLGLVNAIPLDTSLKMTFKLPDGKATEWYEGGVRYTISNRDTARFFIDAFNEISPDLLSTIYYTVKKFGYLPEQELIEQCYAFPEFNEAEFGETIFESNLPDRIEVTNLSEDECEELETALSTKFISAMKRIIEGMDSSELDLKRVKEVEIPV